MYFSMKTIFVSCSYSATLSSKLISGSIRTFEADEFCDQVKQDRQCSYNVTLRRVYQTIFAVEKQ